MSRFKYEVVGPHDKHSISVRSGQSMKSPEEKERLQRGALIKELELVGERLHYELLEGDGPTTGWVSLKLKGKDMLKRTGREPKTVKRTGGTDAKHTSQEPQAQEQVATAPAGVVAGTKPGPPEHAAAVPVFPSSATLPSIPDVISMRTLSEDPRLVLLRTFLTSAEVDLLLALAEGRWQRSGAMKDSTEWQPAGKKKGRARAIAEAGRGPEMINIGFRESELVARILARVASLTKSPLENIGQMTLIRYHAGERYKQVYDGAKWPKSIVCFLNDVPAGGELLFAKVGKQIAPVLGSALMWSNVQSSGQDTLSDKRLEFESLSVGEDCTKYELHCNVSSTPQWNCDHIRIHHQ